MKLYNGKPSTPIMVFADNGVMVDRQTLFTESAKWIYWLQKNNVSRLGLCMGNCPEFLFAFTAALRVGIPTVFIPVSYTESIPECTVLYDADNPQVLRRDGIDVRTVELRNSIDIEDNYDWAENETFAFCATSGTSGKRTWYEHSLHSTWIPLLFRWARPFTRVLPLRIYSASPWFHNTGLHLLLLPLFGIEFLQITMNRFNPILAGKALQEYKPNIWVGTPSMLYRITLTYEKEPHIPSILILSGETLKSYMLRSWSDLHGFQLATCAYGTTETGIISWYLCRGEHVSLWLKFAMFIMKLIRFCKKTYRVNTIKDCFVGPWINGFSVIIHDPDEHGIGKVAVKNPITESKYPDGYFETGDIGYIDGDELYITGRVSNIINRSGEKILPEDIENRIRLLPGIRDMCVFGIPSETHGEGICLVYDGALSDEQILMELPKSLRPDRIIHMSPLPLNESGKVDIPKLREEISANS